MGTFWCVIILVLMVFGADYLVYWVVPVAIFGQNSVVNFYTFLWDNLILIIAIVVTAGFALEDFAQNRNRRRVTWEKK